MPTIFTVLAFLPILVLLIISLWKGVKAGVYTGFLVTTILFFAWESEFITFLASIFSALVGTINILMIIFGAVFLYHIMEQKGYISGIKESLAGIHSDRNFRFFFLAFFMTAFFESVAGFGTPGAIVPLLLISMGFSPVLSIAVVLLIDGLFALTGAVGTPVTAGFESTLQLELVNVNIIYPYAGFIIFIAGLLVTFFVYRFLKSDSGAGPGKQGWILYLVIMIPFFIFSLFLRELTGLMASVFMGIFSYLFFFQE